MFNFRKFVIGAALAVAVAVAPSFSSDHRSGNSVFGGNSSVLTVSAATSETRTFTSAANSFSIYDTNITSINSNASWVTVTGTGRGSYTIKISANPQAYSYMTQRGATLTCKKSGGTVYKYIYIYQDYRYIGSDKTSVTVAATNFETGVYNTKSDTIKISYNCPFTVSSSNSNFVLYNNYGYQVTGNDSFAGYRNSYSQYCYVKCNATPDKDMTGYIYLKNKYNGAIIRTITVTKKASIYKKASVKDEYVGAMGVTFCYDNTDNRATSFEVSSEAKDWVSVSKLTDSEGTYFAVKVRETDAIFTTRSDRQGTVKFRDSNGNLVHTANIHQAYKYLDTNTSQLTIKSGEEYSEYFTLNYNCCFNVEFSNKHFKLVNGSGKAVTGSINVQPYDSVRTDSNLRVIYTEDEDNDNDNDNDKYKSATATLKFINTKSGAVVKTIKITKNGIVVPNEDITFVCSKTDDTMYSKSDGGTFEISKGAFVKGNTVTVYVKDAKLRTYLANKTNVFNLQFNSALSGIVIFPDHYESESTENLSNSMANGELSTHEQGTFEVKKSGNYLYIELKLNSNPDDYSSEGVEGIKSNSKVITLEYKSKYPYYSSIE